MKITCPLTQIKVEQEILRLVEILENETEAFEALSEDAAKKEAKYDYAWAGQFLKNTTGTQKDREAWADYNLENEAYGAKVAEALVRAKREKLSSLRTSIDALRTLAANVRNLT